MQGTSHGILLPDCTDQGHCKHFLGCGNKPLRQHGVHHKSLFQWQETSHSILLPDCTDRGHCKHFLGCGNKPLRHHGVHHKALF